jgi:hypothetical protein
VEDIKRHPFFKNIDWDKIREMESPIIPVLENQYDTRYFDSFDEASDDEEKDSFENNRKNHWHGFTFKSSAAMRRLTLGTWGKGGGTYKFFKSPWEQQDLQTSSTPSKTQLL